MIANKLKLDLNNKSYFPKVNLHMDNNYLKGSVWGFLRVGIIIALSGAGKSQILGKSE